MSVAIKHIAADIDSQKVIERLYDTYAAKLLGYTRKNYNISEDDAMNLVYKTIYRMAEVYDRYSFETDHKRNAFVFKIHINYLRNYYRDNKSFEHKNLEVELKEFDGVKNESDEIANPKLKLLQKLLDKMEDWQRILLLMRGQDIPYNEISKFINKPENQLKVYYARLKKQLHKDMNDELIKGTNEKK